MVGEIEQPPHAPGGEGVIDPGPAIRRPRLGPEQAVFFQGMEQGIDHALLRGDHLAGGVGDGGHDFIAIHLPVLEQAQDQKLRHPGHERENSRS